MTDEQVAITITVADDHLADLDAVRVELEERGMRVEQVLAPIGVITGTAPAGWEELSDIAAVVSVEAQRTMTARPTESCAPEQNPHP